MTTSELECETIGGRLVWTWQHGKVHYRAECSGTDPNLVIVIFSTDPAGGAWEIYTQRKTHGDSLDRVIDKLYDETTGSERFWWPYEPIVPVLVPDSNNDGRTGALHLRMAEMLLATLRAMNLADPDNSSGLDGFYASDAIRFGELMPYKHVQSALLASLAGLVGGGRELAQRLLNECHDNGEDVAYNLQFLADFRAELSESA